MGAEQSRDKWSPEGDLRLLLEHSENQENDQSILSLGHLSRQKVSTAIKRSFRFAQKPAKCICTKYTKINSTADELCLRQLFSEKVSNFNAQLIQFKIQFTDKTFFGTILDLEDDTQTFQKLHRFTKPFERFRVLPEYFITTKNGVLVSQSI